MSEGPSYTTPNEGLRLSTSGELAGVCSRQGLVDEFLASAFYTGVQSPLEALAQVVDQTAGTGWQRHCQFIQRPVPAEFLSNRWITQQAGSAAGALPWFLALHKATSALMPASLAGRAASLAEHTRLTARQSLALNSIRALESGIAGLVYGGLLTPVQPEHSGNFWQTRFAQASSSALTFGTLSFSAGGLRHVGESVVSARALRNPVLASTLAGIPAGLVSANTESIFAGRGIAKFDDQVKAVTTFSLLGAGFGVINRRLSGDRSASDPQTDAKAAETSISRSLTEPEGNNTVRRGADAPVKVESKLPAERVQNVNPIDRPAERPLSEILAEIKDRRAKRYHAPDLYAKAFEGSDLKGVRYLGAGSDTVRIELADGNIMKIGFRPLLPDMGSRPFDAPILQRGSLPVGKSLVHYFVQPRATTPVTMADYVSFLQRLQGTKYNFSDPQVSQLGYEQGTNRVLLLDPWAVETIPGR